MPRKLTSKGLQKVVNRASRVPAPGRSQPGARVADLPGEMDRRQFMRAIATGAAGFVAVALADCGAGVTGTLLDGGPARPDSALPGLDGAAPGADGSSPGVDAGSEGADAAAGPDAARPGKDAGAQGADAGTSGSETPPPPSGGATHTVTTRTVAAINSTLATAKAGDTVYCPGGAPYTGNLTSVATVTVPDNIHLKGDGIYNQGVSGGDGGTWIQAQMRWGSNVYVDNMLVGVNMAGATCQFYPVARGNAAAGSETEANGSHDNIFSLVRFKGGADTTAGLLDLGGNWSGGWGVANYPIKKRDMVRTWFYDCEFERPQARNSVGVTSTFSGGNPGNTLDIWCDMRVGGAVVSGNRWYRCHFGVKNGYSTGLDGYGNGTSMLFQPAPSGSGKAPATGNADTGPSLTGGSAITSSDWNSGFDWGQLEHNFTDNHFEDCLWEYSTWYSADICDCARTYSTWHGVQAGFSDGSGGGWGNPPGTQWVNIPDACWNDGLWMTRCYNKGSYPTAHGVVGEIGRNCKMIDCYCGTGTVFNQQGRYGNVASGSFAGGRPSSPIFTVDWTGATTSYTPSPYDPT